MGFSRQEYWSGLPFSSPGDLPNPRIEPRSLALQADGLTSEPPGKPTHRHTHTQYTHTHTRMQAHVYTQINVSEYILTHTHSCISPKGNKNKLSFFPYFPWSIKKKRKERKRHCMETEHLFFEETSEKEGMC